MPVTIVGGGVSGLTCAITLAEDPMRRFDVKVVASRVAGESLSAVAAASFYPYAVEHPHVDRWLAVGLRRFRELAATEPAAGVRMKRGVQVATSRVAAAPWRDLVVDYRMGLDGRVGVGAEYVDGHQFEVPIIEMPIYLAYLKQRFDRDGTRIERCEIEDLSDCVGKDRVVVNCSGVLARRLANDLSLTPTLGQLLRVSKEGMVDEFRIDKEEESNPSYVVVRSNDCVLGSIDRPWPIERGFEPPPADEGITRSIRARCSRLEPAVRDAVLLDAYCGLRPRRPTVRVEIDRERLARGERVIHDYGHGGAGVTLSWGCAEEVRELVATFSAQGA